MGHLLIPQIVYESEESRWNYTVRENRRTRIETGPKATLSTTSSTWSDPSANPGLLGERPLTNRLSHITTKRSLIYDFVQYE